ncbi:MAG: transketolase [Planctomycetia bacterium]|nr:transketolase [Planctomycetia bacterium]
MTPTAVLAAISKKIRARVVEMSHVAETPHLGSSLSCIDMIVAAYWAALRIDPSNPLDPNRDRFILSKGHAATALYVTLAERGFFDPALLETYNEDGAVLPEHPGLQCVPGIEAATGSLGHGLPLALGMALAARIEGRPSRCLVLMSDGECEEGSVWEAAMFAPAQKLDSVTVMIDYNKWQATGRSDEIMALAPLAEKWRAFGWDACEVDGHDFDALLAALDKRPDGSGRPRAIICHTVKGKGVSFMEDDNNWHYRIPTAEEVRKARVELGQPEVRA